MIVMYDLRTFFQYVKLNEVYWSVKNDNFKIVVILSYTRSKNFKILT